MGTTKSGFITKLNLAIQEKESHKHVFCGHDHEMDFCSWVVAGQFLVIIGEQRPIPSGWSNFTRKETRQMNDLKNFDPISFISKTFQPTLEAAADGCSCGCSGGCGLGAGSVGGVIIITDNC